LYYLSLERPIPGKWVTIPAGSFVMGMDENEARVATSLCREGALEKEKCPNWEDLLNWSGRQARVTLPAFAILDNEVTNAQYYQCVDAGVCQPREDYDRNVMNMPATSLDWFQAQAYCEWLVGRLPTEGEWEKAARGPNNFSFPWGDTWDAEKANLELWGIGTMQSINRYAKTDISGYGIKNMAGNVLEWTASEALPFPSDQDFSNKVFERENDGNDWPVILRGGSWQNARSAGMAANRVVDSVLSQRDIVGFRCVCPEGKVCRSPWSWSWIWFGK